MLPNNIADATKKSAEQEISRRANNQEVSAAVQAAVDRVASAAQQAARKATEIISNTETKLNALESEYAVGKGLIERADVDNFRNTYLAQGELSLGLIIPMLLIVFAVLVDNEHVGSYSVVLLGVFATSAFLFFTAIERRNRYRTELKLLLLGRLQKQLDAEQAAKDAKKNAPDKPATPPVDPVRKAIQEELKNLSLEVKPLVVELHTDPKSKKVDPPTSGGAAPVK